MIHPDRDGTAAAETIYNVNQAFWWDAARIIEDDFTFPLFEKAPSERKGSKGKKDTVISDSRRGRYIYAERAGKDLSDLAIDATLREAVLHREDRAEECRKTGRAVSVHPADLMKKVRVRSNASLIVFLVDLSWSMAVTRRMEATKKAIKALLTKAYQFRDDICLITFQKDRADLVIPPTHSIALAERQMKALKVGGKTPLAAGLTEAERIMRLALRNYQAENIILILLSDCDGNVAMSDGDPEEEAMRAAASIASGKFRSIVINSDQMTFDQGNANRLAKKLNASCYLIPDFNSDHLIKAVREEL